MPLQLCACYQAARLAALYAMACSDTHQCRELMYCIMYAAQPLLECNHCFLAPTTTSCAIMTLLLLHLWQVQRAGLT